MTLPVAPGSPHRVVVVCVPEVIAFDVSAVVETLRWVYLSGGEPAYQVLTAGPEPRVPATSMTMLLDHDLEVLGTADTVVLPGRVDPSTPLDPAVVDAVRAAYARGARVVSLCVGAFDLARTGLLDGRRATTHWRAAHQLAQLFPAVTVDAGVLWVDEGRILTAAGATAGVDLCLHLIERDHGVAAALDAARSAVVPLVRTGGQAQFALPAPASGVSSPLAPLLSWLEANLSEPLTLATIAEQAHLSTRSLTRRFREQLGSTPMEWVTAARLRLARSLLESTDAPVAHLAERCGFGSAATLRARFAAALGVSPRAYRQAFRARQSSVP